MNRFVLQLSSGTKIHALHQNEEDFLKNLAHYIANQRYLVPENLLDVQDWMRNQKLKYQGCDFNLDEVVRVVERRNHKQYNAGAMYQTNVGVYNLALDPKKYKFVEPTVLDEYIFIPREDVLNQVKNLPIGEMADLEKIQENLELEKDDFNSKIVQCLVWKLFKLYYKVNGPEQIGEYHNDWTENLASLNKVFITGDGQEINGGELGNILVGFKRVEPEEEVNPQA